MKNEKTDYKNIPGWGMDIDPGNEPTYPMKNYTGDDHKRSVYERSNQQHADVEILKSNERPALSAVLGNTVPPSGISGMIRRYAFKHSEDRYRHWIPLILADRVNVVEGIIEDLSRGIIPNIFAESGIRAAIRHNPKGLLKKVIITSVVAGVILYALKKKK
ncbi:MAG: hypothetical protein EOO20_02940 [Chryseobacterium sp.]|uniref:Uncharacterized protein n=1 Tax=Pedobacter agri TaxID=454586 RepID=A0A9X3DJR4_9SPHI|nr:hypothetical protein [Pedobacter agri]MCX3267516.1 hypothetical protein [Pedobacter agri]RZJ92105.1 MAG: hypothetical protein EOO20_02940 [Chryseobacterium sp.]